MDSLLFTQQIDQINQEQSIYNLESGQVLFFPDHAYSTIEPLLMSPDILDGKHKNISYDYKKNKLGGFNSDLNGIESQLQPLMQGYATFAFDLIQKALPAYIPHLQWGRTSFRPAQISGRAISKRKDDTRLHVDSFPATPVNGLRILRVFCNVNPHNEPRVWNIGEPFSQVLERFAPQVPAYSALKAKLLKLVKATKTLRSPYDHYMLQLHDRMKLDDGYQEQVEKTQIDFPSQSAWIVYTDHVSHAALSGQYLLEQTFYLPVDKMANAEQSPFHQLKKYQTQCTTS